MSSTTSSAARTGLILPALAPLYAALDTISLPLLRLVTGWNLIPHGAQKLFGWFGGYGIDGTAQWLESQGFVPGHLWVWLIALTELVGGTLLAVGFLTRAAAVPVIIFMLAAVSFHWANGFSWQNAGYEYPLMWAVAAFVFLTRGGGALSVDRVLGREI